ncbi:hypothetical protein N6B72_07645 [Chryseobacterium soli]|uniref:hypothetical protein n=1 Tax=Chryseobacterium soli TaxID=445961 RepID=UPI002953F9C7|nr:hypothetical protein [Chryseobacterium soli]MDV7696788.1 hypothetical protein [Chryseobacterium soli]
MLTELEHKILGTKGIRLDFESKFSLILYFWEDGIIDITCLYSRKKYWGFVEEIKELMVYTYTPKDYQNKMYPQESFDILLEKLGELKKRIEKIDSILKQK